MKESCADIAKYLSIVEGRIETTPSEMNDEGHIHLGIHSAGASIGKIYLFDNGLQWLKIVSENADNWIVQYGLIEHQSNNFETISKRDLSSLIARGELELLNENHEIDLILESNNMLSEYDEFLNKVNKYLLRNYNLESQDIDFDWVKAWKQGLMPDEAAEEAILQSN